MDTADVLKQLDDLIASYRGLLAKSKYPDLSDLGVALDAIVVRLNAAIERLAPPSSAYRKEAASHLKEPAHLRLEPLVGILLAMREDIAAGWLATVAELLHADTFSDFLEMSVELRKSGYKDAAAVIGGTVLESHLRLLGTKNGIVTTQPNGAPKKADAINADLAAGAVYSKLQQKLITGWLGIRNAAAHGNYGDYSDQDVAALITSVREFVTKNPA